jgi:hypothetical protein
MIFVSFFLKSEARMPLQAWFAVPPLILSTLGWPLAAQAHLQAVIPSADVLPEGSEVTVDFAALLDGDATMPSPEGKPAPIETGGVIWVKATEMGGT